MKCSSHPRPCFTTLGASANPSTVPIRKPPMCAMQSIPGTRDISTFTASSLPISQKRLEMGRPRLCLTSTKYTKTAEDSPKMAPEAPIETQAVVRHEEIDPARPLTRKIATNLRLPKRVSHMVPQSQSAQMLENRCIRPPWRKKAEMSRQYSLELRMAKQELEKVYRQYELKGWPQTSTRELRRRGTKYPRAMSTESVLVSGTDNWDSSASGSCWAAQGSSISQRLYMYQVVHTNQQLWVLPQPAQSNFWDGSSSRFSLQLGALWPMALQSQHCAQLKAFSMDLKNAWVKAKSDSQKIFGCTLSHLDPLGQQPQRQSSHSLRGMCFFSQASPSMQKPRSQAGQDLNTCLYSQLPAFLHFPFWKYLQNWSTSWEKSQLSPQAQLPFSKLVQGFILVLRCWKGQAAPAVHFLWMKRLQTPFFEYESFSIPIQQFQHRMRLSLQQMQGQPKVSFSEQFTQTMLSSCLYLLNNSDAFSVPLRTRCPPSCSTNRNSVSLSDSFILLFTSSSSFSALTSPCSDMCCVIKNGRLEAAAGSRTMGQWLGRLQARLAFSLRSFKLYCSLKRI